MGFHIPRLIELIFWGYSATVRPFEYRIFNQGIMNI